MSLFLRQMGIVFGDTPNGQCRRMESISIRTPLNFGEIWIWIPTLLPGPIFIPIAVLHGNFIKNFRVLCFRRITSISSSQLPWRWKVLVFFVFFFFLFKKKKISGLTEASCTCFCSLTNYWLPPALFPNHAERLDFVLCIASKLYGQISPPLTYMGSPFWSG